jgi:hypothetical protein
MNNVNMSESNCPRCRGSGHMINQCCRCHGEGNVPVMNHLESCPVCTGIWWVHRGCEACHGCGIADRKNEPYGSSTAHGSGIERPGDNAVVPGLWGVGKPHMWSFGRAGHHETPAVSTGDALRQTGDHIPCEKCLGTGTYKVPCIDCDKTGWGNWFDRRCRTCYGRGYMTAYCYHSRYS